MLVDRGERREAEAASDLLQTGRVAVLPDELVQVIENLALAFCERKHAVTIRKRKAKVNTEELEYVTAVRLSGLIR